MAQTTRLLDLTSAGTPALKAAALQTLLANTGVLVRYIDTRYVAVFPWRPNRDPEFGTGTVETAFGLDATAATGSVGPFIRPQERALTCTFTLTRRTGFPADGLARARNVVLQRVTEYGIGEELWEADLSCVAEAIPGTRITNFVIQYNGANVSGVAVPLDIRWTLSLLDVFQSHHNRRVDHHA